MRLLPASDVAREQNHAARLQPCEQQPESRRHLSAVEAHNQQLADFFGN